MRALHDEHAGALLSYVVTLTGGDRARAEDVVQETMLRAWRHLPSIDRSQSSARGWLFTVAKRIVIDDWRTTRIRPEQVTAQPPERPISDEAERRATAAVVLDALRTLTPEHRAVVIECYYHGLSVAEAAQRLGIPPGTVKSRTHYALHALRGALAELGALS
jgi:RNA polymerase sigma-70 factor, ECF subfamily